MRYIALALMLALSSCKYYEVTCQGTVYHGVEVYPLNGNTWKITYFKDGKQYTTLVDSANCKAVSVQ